MTNKRTEVPQRIREADETRAEEVRAARASLVAEGLIRDSGRRRNGQIVWVITELGKQVAEQLAMSGATEFPEREQIK